MSASKRRHTRKARRQSKQTLRFKNAKRAHRRISGRTGSIFTKKLKSRGHV